MKTDIEEDSENSNNPGDKVPPGVRRPSNKSLGSTAKSKSTIHSRLDKSETDIEHARTHAHTHTHTH